MLAELKLEFKLAVCERVNLGLLSEVNFIELFCFEVEGERSIVHRALGDAFIHHSLTIID